MKIKDLIKKLQEIENQDLEVSYWTHASDPYHPVRTFTLINDRGRTPTKELPANKLLLSAENEDDSD